MNTNTTQYAKPRRIRGIPVPNLQSWRFEKLLTQSQLANRAGLTSKTVGVIERGGNCDLANVHKLAKALEVTTDQLLKVNPHVRGQ